MNAILRCHTLCFENHIEKHKGIEQKMKKDAWTRTILSSGGREYEGLNGNEKNKINIKILK